MCLKQQWFFDNRAIIFIYQKKTKLSKIMYEYKLVAKQEAYLTRQNIDKKYVNLYFMKLIRNITNNYCTEFKMQPTIHLKCKAGYRRGKYPALRCKCILGCIFNSVGLIITSESLCIYGTNTNYAGQFHNRPASSPDLRSIEIMCIFPEWRKTSIIHSYQLIFINFFHILNNSHLSLNLLRSIHCIY
jgi:hypothetical protein